MSTLSAQLRLYATAPQSKDVQASEFADKIVEVAGWSERAGFDGILIYTDNMLADPWLVAHLVIQATRELRPLVAVQPVYMHPFAVAKMVSTLVYLHGRGVDLNLVAGGFRNDLLSLGDETEHDARYERLTEYAQVVKGILRAPRPYSYHGRYYALSNAVLRPELPEGVDPRILVSGSSPAGLSAARAVGATAVKYPRPAREEEDTPREEGLELGVRVGVIARPTDEEAWDVAWARFPGDRRGQLTHRLAMEVSDSHWHRDLAEQGNGIDPEGDVYWLWPFQNYKTFCPYLVGGYDRVGVALADYLGRGFSTFIVDIPEASGDLEHTNIAFARALAGEPV